LLGALVLAALAAGTGCAKPNAAPQGAPGQSFHDSFDKIDGRRWYISSGWSNGAIQGCTWDSSRVKVDDGVLTLSVSPAKATVPGCAEIRTHARLGYGTYEARIRTAKGSGLNSAMFTYSGKPLTPVHDEIDFEFLGKSDQTVQLNYFEAGKGGHETFPDLGFNPSAQFHDYAFEWFPEHIRWYVDGKLVREVTSQPLPSTSGQFFLTLWMGGAPAEGWLGAIDRTKLPAQMQVDWIAFTKMGERCRFSGSFTCG